MSEKTVEQGNVVAFEYTGTFEDGSVFDSSEEEKPMEVLAGKGMLIKGLDDVLVGMNVGDEKEVNLTPDDGYGHPRDELVQTVPKSQLGDEVTPEVGMTLGVQSPDGQVFPAVIKEVKDDDIILDANHPLAGKNINFKIKVVDTRVPSEEDIKKFTSQEESTEEESSEEEQGEDDE